MAEKQRKTMGIHQKCGLRHWPFEDCDVVRARYAAEDAEKARVYMVRTFNDPRTPWGGTRLQNFEQIAPNVFMRKRP